LAPSAENGLKRGSIALVFQLRAIDIKRLVNRIGILEKDYIGEIEKNLKGLLLLIEE